VKKRQLQFLALYSRDRQTVGLVLISGWSSRACTFIVRA